MHFYQLNLMFGYCVLFSGRDPLAWSTRLQIALDSARGLEYIHEHTVPVYIHRDIKSANILIDKNFRAKVEKSSCCEYTDLLSSSILLTNTFTGCRFWVN